MLFRRTLLRIRREYVDDKKRLILVSILSVIVLGVGSYFLDMVLPLESWGMFIRTFILIPLALAIALLSYVGIIAYCFHNAKKEGWVSWRERFSPVWRQRISLIIGAVLFVLAIGLAQDKPGYTLYTSIIASIVILLFIFMRKTSSEIRRAELGIPDARDLALNAHLRKTAEANAAKKSKSKDEKIIEKKEARIQAKVEKAKERLAKAEKELENHD